MTILECANLLSSMDDILLLTHKNPDGDTIMSAAALCRALRRMHKTAYLYPNQQITKNLLPFAEALFAPESFAPEYVVSVDTAKENLFPVGFDGMVDLAIDHHRSNSHFALEELIGSEYSACGEIIQQLIVELTGTLTKTEATLLFIALTTDNGAFQYANTNEKSFYSAAELLRAGADLPILMHHFFRRTSIARLRLEGMIFSQMHVYHEERVIIASVTRKMMLDAGATEDDCSDLAGVLNRAGDGCVLIMIREAEDGSSKVSVRTAPGFGSSRAICAAFGGGGHEMAAGCTIPLPPEKAEPALLDVVEEVCRDQL